MSSMFLAFSSDAVAASTPLSSLAIGACAHVSSVTGRSARRVEILLALGVSPGARVTMLQTFPGVVFLCDQTELAVERAVADSILVRPVEAKR
jgi:DtxR family transcriptional regulator, Mn-dependent transcriptional regulator